MSIEAINFVKQRELGEHEDPTNRLLLMIIAEATFNDSCRCKIGQQQLAREMRITDRAVRRRIGVLKAADVIVCHPDYLREGGRKPDAIEIVGFEAAHKQRRTDEQKTTAAQPDTAASGNGGLPDPAISGRATGRSCVHAPGQQSSGSIKKPVLFVQERTPLPPASGGYEPHDAFAEFLAAYPRGRYSHTKLAPARKAFAALVADLEATTEEIIAGAKAFARSRPEPDFIPAALRWLNARSWLDRPERRVTGANWVRNVCDPNFGGVTAHDTEGGRAGFLAYRARMIAEGKFDPTKVPA